MLQERVVGRFLADGCCRPVPGDDAGGFRKRQQIGVNGTKQCGGVAAGQIGSADASGEEGVPGEQKGVLREIEAEAPRGVPGGVQNDAAE